MNEMNHDYSIDFVRLIATIGVIIFHYSVYSNYPFTLKLGAPVWNTLFFMVSGFLLHKKYSNFDNFRAVAAFYKNRALRIFPVFYLVWFYFHMKTSVMNGGEFFYAGKPLNILLTVIGMDGYLSQRFTTYYQVGEWFLGAIIICFLLYPLLLKIYSKNKYSTLFGLFVLYAVYYYSEIPRISISYNCVFECLFKFSMGMYLSDVINKLNIYTKISAFIIPFVYLNIKGVADYLISKILFWFSWFIILYLIGQFITKNQGIKKGIKFFSRYSFTVLLIQHKIILMFIERHNPSIPSHAYIYVALTIAWCFVAAFIIDFLFKHSVQ